MSQILLKLWLIGNRTSCRPIRSVIILVVKQIGLPQAATRSFDFVNHLYDYRPNWTPLNPVTITNYSHRIFNVLLHFEITRILV